MYVQVEKNLDIWKHMSHLLSFTPKGRLLESIMIHEY